MPRCAFTQRVAMRSNTSPELSGARKAQIVLIKGPLIMPTGQLCGPAPG
eukprot:CAMPEP_0180512156 /NCGR_PEP_ID=MMETSP1036_2-20121128/51429_1 /TAXON_ID=632150 /ORGANISM="Azadinium spinosum, Strain 3D9" /LENGTH=48 /DNA_ID= /DNA_START= /DNA_END= /DNA_ORIENTATION=